ncbi:WhiB family transcriptional regulator [Catenulispora yoronensis]|uniref:WhiB family transcriptional regulator n=1 Tax=Catenulispora yoronensis TaxID=450799 RepID=UPI0031D7FB3D
MRVTPGGYGQMFQNLPGWMAEAECRDSEPDLFFGADPGWGRITETIAQRRAREAQAKAMCARCPVRNSCLEYAMTTPEHDGLWGGLTDAERKAMRRATMRLKAPASVS